MHEPDVRGKADDLSRLPLSKLERGVFSFEKKLLGDELEAVDDFLILNDAEVAGEVRLIDEQVFVSGKIRARLQTTCGRCLKPFDSSKDSALNFMIDPEGKSSIDLLSFFREEIFCGSTGQMLCRHDCKGLCGDCGSNLNDTVCKCSGNTQFE